MEFIAQLIPNSLYRFSRNPKFVGDLTQLKTLHLLNHKLHATPKTVVEKHHIGLNNPSPTNSTDFIYGSILPPDMHKYRIPLINSTQSHPEQGKCTPRSHQYQNYSCLSPSLTVVNLVFSPPIHPWPLPIILSPLRPRNANPNP